MKTHYRSSVLNPDYSFKNYHITSRSRIIIDTVSSIIENGMVKHYPIFIHGSYGTGKTHLLQAIAHKYNGACPKRKVCYFTCEEFVNNIINTIYENRFKAFKNELRCDIDILIIDDAHILKDKQYTQEEVLRIFDMFYKLGKIAIISADIPPRELFQLSSNLFSTWQFKTYELESPDKAEMDSYLKRKEELFGIDLSSIVNQPQSYDYDFRKLTSLINTAILKTKVSLHAEYFQNNS